MNRSLGVYAATASPRGRVPAECVTTFRGLSFSSHTPARGSTQHRYPVRGRDQGDPRPYRGDSGAGASRRDLAPALRFPGERPVTPGQLTGQPISIGTLACVVWPIPPRANSDTRQFQISRVSDDQRSKIPPVRQEGHPIGYPLPSRRFDPGGRP